MFFTLTLKPASAMWSAHIWQQPHCGVLYTVTGASSLAVATVANVPEVLSESSSSAALTTNAKARPAAATINFFLVFTIYSLLGGLLLCRMLFGTDVRFPRLY